MRRPKNNNRRAMLFITFVMILLLGIGFVQVSSSYSKNLQKEAEVAQLMEEIEAEKLNHIELTKTLEDMKSREFIEKMARSRFGLIYPNEVLIDTEQVQ